MATATVPQYRTSYTVKARSRAGEHEGDMEGTTHATTGMLAGAGLGLLSHAAAHRAGVPVWEGLGRDALFGLVTGGMALLPDADHPKATFAYAAGPLSHGISHLVTTVTGGHRQGAHSLAGMAAVALAVQSCAVWWPNRWALGFLAAFLAICVVAGLKATGFMRHRGGRLHGSVQRLAIGCTVAALAVVYVRADLWWLSLLGMAIHIFEDMMTGHGVALFWPLTSHRIGGDGKQPAASRSAARRPAARRPARGRARPVTRPSAERPPAERPRQRRAPRPPLSMCPSCWVGECESCKGRGCGCPQPATSHQGRKRPRDYTHDGAPPPDKTVPSTVLPENDPPPF